jgi:hypothetical protein
MVEGSVNGHVLSYWFAIGIMSQDLWSCNRGIAIALRCDSNANVVFDSKRKRKRKRVERSDPGKTPEEFDSRLLW